MCCNQLIFGAKFIGPLDSLNAVVDFDNEFVIVWSPSRGGDLT